MNAARTEIADFQRVVVRKYALHSQIPLQRVRTQLRRRHPRGGKRSSRGSTRDWTRFSGNDATSQESTEIRIAICVSIDGREELRRKRIGSEVLINLVVAHAEASSDRGFTTRPRRPGKTNARREVLRGRLR